MAVDEKQAVESRDTDIEDVSRNSTHSSVAEAARGAELSELPPNYYWNWRFLGSLTAVVFMAQGLYLGTYRP